MGLLKKLYGEAQRVRHSGNIGKDFSNLQRGTGKRYAQAKAKYEGYKEKKRYEAFKTKMKWD